MPYPTLPGSTPLLFQPSMGRFYDLDFDLINDTLQNRLLGWKLANAHGNHTLPQPVLAIYPKQVRNSFSEPSTLIMSNLLYRIP